MFDSLNIADCIVPTSSGGNNPGGGGNQTDQRCLDAEFAAANPAICSSSPYLVIKPAYALVCALGSIQFDVYLYQNGVETLVDTNLTFTTSDDEILAVGTHNGSATGLTEGEAVVTVTRNGMTAKSVVTVLSNETCCDDISAKTSILLDNSKSSGLTFGAGYSSRLLFGRAAALLYSETILGGDVPKDSIKIWSFTDVADDVSGEFLTDVDEIADEINGVSQTQQKTDIGLILQTAIDDLLTQEVDEKIIVLISDGEQTSSTNVQPALDAAAMFKSAGGIIIVIGLRASGAGYDLLTRIATGGFFLNATPNNADDILKQINYLKSILCVGECLVEGAAVNSPEIDYSSFINWEVIAGQVSLIGNGFLDVQPGHGLYVDMMGGSAGTIRSIDSFSMKSGRTYRISFKAAGNNRHYTPDANAYLSVKIINADPTTPELLQTIFQANVNPAWDDSFATYMFSFVAQYDADVKIQFEQIYDPTFTGDWHGNLLDDVKFEDVTTIATLIYDDFNDENSKYPDSYGYGQECSEPDVQSQDPNPLPDVESGLPNTSRYTSTKSACASCSSGDVNVKSSNAVPIMTSNTTPSGFAFEQPFPCEIWDSRDIPGNEAETFRLFDGIVDNTEANSYWIAFACNVGGITPSSFQFGYRFDSAKSITHYAITCLRSGTSPRAFTFEGSNDGCNWTELDRKVNLNWYNGERKTFEVPTPGSYTHYKLGVYEVDVNNTEITDENLYIQQLELFESASAQICKTATASSYISQADADNKAFAAALASAQAELNCVHQYTSTQQYTAKCPAGGFGPEITKTASATSLISQEDADAMALAEARELAEAELDCTGSNNTQPITIADNSPASPYPSVKYVSDFVGTISKVTVDIKKLSHDCPSDIQFLLVAPDGTGIILMQHCGGTVPVENIDLTFDDDAAESLPESTIIADGTYKPTKFGATSTFNPPAPSGPYGTALSAFAGIDPNGSWALWVLDNKVLDVGSIAEGWDLTIT